jgi:hypothetical protein
MSLGRVKELLIMAAEQAEASAYRMVHRRSVENLRPFRSLQRGGPFGNPNTTYFPSLRRIVSCMTR